MTKCGASLSWCPINRTPLDVFGHCSIGHHNGIWRHQAFETAHTLTTEWQQSSNCNVFAAGGHRLNWPQNGSSFFSPFSWHLSLFSFVYCRWQFESKQTDTHKVITLTRLYMCLFVWANMAGGKMVVPYRWNLIALKLIIVSILIWCKFDLSKLIC